jgi:hypothetical protein
MRIRVQKHWKFSQNLQINLTSSLSKKPFVPTWVCFMTYYLHKKYIFHLKIQLLVIGKVKPGSGSHQHWLDSWIRIHIDVTSWIRFEANADPQHLKAI